MTEALRQEGLSRFSAGRLNAARAEVGPQRLPADPEGGDREHGADEPDVPGNERVAVEHTPLAQEVVPVMLTAADQRQLHGPGVGDIAGDVPAVLSRPPERDAGGVAVAAAPEVDHEGQRHEQLQQGAAEGREDVSAPGEHEVACLVDRQVDGVEQVVPIGGPQVPDAVECQRHRQCATPRALGAGDRAHAPLFLSSQRIGSQSSTLLPSGSMIHANLPFSWDSGPWMTSTPPARRLLQHLAEVIDPVVDHERRMARAEPLAVLLGDVPHGQAVIIGLVVRPFEDGAAKVLQRQAQVRLIPGRQCGVVACALEEDAADSGDLCHRCPLVFSR